MATTDKAKNTAEQAKGKLKETAGRLSGNAGLRAEGKADQTKGSLEQAGEMFRRRLLGLATHRSPPPGGEFVMAGGGLVDAGAGDGARSPEVEEVPT